MLSSLRESDLDTRHAYPTSDHWLHVAFMNIDSTRLNIANSTFQVGYIMLLAYLYGTVELSHSLCAHTINYNTSRQAEFSHAACNGRVLMSRAAAGSDAA